MIEVLAILGMTVLLVAQFLLPLIKAMNKTMVEKQLSLLSPPSTKPASTSSSPVIFQNRRMGLLPKKHFSLLAPPPPPMLPFSRPLPDGNGPAVDITKVESGIAQSSVKKNHAIVDRDPGAALHLIRRWMYKSA